MADAKIRVDIVPNLLKLPADVDTEKARKDKELSPTDFPSWEPL